MLFKSKNQKGFTLVELLASITILGIVFIGILSIFPQMSNFNMQTANKLEAMNLAKKELAELRDGIYNLSEYEELGTRGTITTYVKAQSGYRYEIDYYNNEDLHKYEGVPNTVQLNKVHIKIKKNDKVISETFGYLTE